jgi:gliding motility-associated-like protein
MYFNLKIYLTVVLMFLNIGFFYGQENCEAYATIDGNLKLCKQIPEGIISINLSGEPPFAFTVSHNGIDIENISEVNLKVYDLLVSKEGVYTVKKFTSNGCKGYTVGEAQVDYRSVTSEIIVTDVSCSGKKDGRLEWNATGGFEPYSSIILNSDKEVQHSKSLVAGIYQFIVSDEKGCIEEKIFEISEPQKLQVSPLKCKDIDGSNVEINIKGGTGKYFYSSDNGQTFLPFEQSIKVEKKGYNLITFKDQNNCFEELEVFNPKDIRLDKVKYDFRLGDSVQVNWITILDQKAFKQISWTPNDIIGCSSCLYPRAYTTQKTVLNYSIKDIHNCVYKGQTILDPNRRESLYIPNVFSPNSDGINDVFVITGKSQAIKRIIHLSIFNRFGSLVYINQNFSLNDINSGWDGTQLGKKVASDVYTYKVVLEYVDGFEETSIGTVTLLN